MVEMQQHLLNKQPKHQLKHQPNKQHQLNKQLQLNKQQLVKRLQPFQLIVFNDSEETFNKDSIARNNIFKAFLVQEDFLEDFKVLWTPVAIS